MKRFDEAKRSALPPFGPTGQYEVADHAIPHRAPSPEVELTAVRAALQVRQGQVRVQLDHRGMLLHVLPDANGIISPLLRVQIGAQ